MLHHVSGKSVLRPNQYFNYLMVTRHKHKSKVISLMLNTIICFRILFKMSLQHRKLQPPSCILIFPDPLLIPLFLTPFPNGNPGVRSRQQMSHQCRTTHSQGFFYSFLSPLLSMYRMKVLSTHSAHPACAAYLGRYKQVHSLRMVK